MRIMERQKIPFNVPFITGKELFYIAKAVLGKDLIGDGLYTKACQRWLEEKHGCSKALLTHSCTAALEMAAILSDIHPGDEVIMPSFTFVSTANAFVLRGGIPVFIDIRSDTLNIDEELIEEAITSQTKAIVPVHYAGVACKMDMIMDIAKRHQLIVVEDTAQALLSSYQGRPLGSIGHLGCLSFHGTKNVISGEGGALLINDEAYVERAEIIREKGTNRSKFFRGEVDKYTWIDLGSSFLPSEIIGAFLFAQLEQADKIVDTRCRIFNIYWQMLSPLAEKGFIRLPCLEKEGTPNGHIFYILTGSLEERSRLIEYLKMDGIHATFHYIPLHSSPAGSRFGRVSGEMKYTNETSGRILRLPLYYEMKEEEILRVVERIRSFYLK
jgi:dTDP-4-amino-4,6-dideoxygalactose transaminase